MPLPIFEKKDDIPKGFEEGYEERDGKWHPVDTTAKLKRALEDERELRREAEATAKKAAKDARAAQEAADAHKAGMTEAELKALHEKIEVGIRAEYAPQLTAAEKTAAENRTLRLTNVVLDMGGEGGLLADKRSRFWKLYGDEFDLSSDGKPIVKAEPGKDVGKHVAALLKQEPGWVAGTKAAGGGAAGIQGGGAASDLTAEAVLKNPSLAFATANARQVTAL